MDKYSFITLILLSLVVISAPRRGAMLALIFATLFLTQGAQIKIAGFTFFPTRILEVICFTRVLIRRELDFRHLHTIDRRVLCLYLFVAVVNGISPHRQLDTIARAGDALLCYFAFRGLITGMEDVRWLLRTLVILLVPFVFLLAVESFTHHNLFTLVGGDKHVWVRGDRMRCFGSFRQPILLGSVGATFFPVYMALASERPQRSRFLIGALLCMAIVGFSNSGGPLSAFLASVAGLFLWQMRHRMYVLRRVVVVTIVLLMLVMKAPIFYVLARVSSVTGGGGWHRAHLMDEAWQTFSQWWLWGMPVLETRDWFAYYLKATGGADLTNQFVVFGVAAGIGAVFLAVYLLVGTFRSLGNAMSLVRQKAGERTLDEKLLWSFGVVVGVHVINWLGISYFDQFLVIWCFHLAAIASLVKNVPAALAEISQPDDQPNLREPVFAGAFDQPPLSV
jgi:hypothetical protein